MTMSIAMRSAAVRSSAARRSSSSQAVWAANTRRVQDLRRMQQVRRTQQLIQLQAAQRAAQVQRRIIQQQTIQANQRRTALARQNQLNRINQVNARNRLLQQQNRQTLAAINNRNIQNRISAQRLLNQNRQQSIANCLKNLANHHLRQAREIKASNQNNSLKLKAFNAQTELSKQQANSRAQQISNMRGRQLLNQIRMQRESMRQQREKSLLAPKKTIASHATSQRHSVSSIRPVEKQSFSTAASAARTVKASGPSFSHTSTPIAPRSATQRQGSNDSFRSSRNGSPPKTGDATPQANNLNLGIRLRTEYTLQTASVVDSKGRLTSEAIKTAKEITVHAKIGNPDVIKAIVNADPLLKKWRGEVQKKTRLSEKVLKDIKADSAFQKWGKYETTQEVIFENQKIYVHFYKNGQTHQIVSSIDYKVKAELQKSDKQLGNASLQANNPSIRTRTDALQKAFVVDSKGYLTSKAIKTTERLTPAKDIGNHDVLKAIIKADPKLNNWLGEAQKKTRLSEKVLKDIKADSTFQKWGEYRTAQKVIFENKKIQVHFYKNGETHQIFSSTDYKVKVSKASESEIQLKGNMLTENGDKIYPKEFAKCKTDNVNGCVTS